MIRHRFRHSAWLLTAMAGCVASKPAPPPADLTLQTVRAVGSPLGKPTTAPFMASAAVGVRVVWLALPSFSDKGLIPLDAASSLTAAPMGDGAVLPAGRMGRAARFGSGTNAIQWIEQLPASVTRVGQQSGFVSPGTTLRFDAGPGPLNLPVSIAIFREPVGKSLATAPSTAEAASPATAPAPYATFAIALAPPSAQQDGSTTAASETAYINHQPLSPDMPYVLLLPAQSGGPVKAIAAFIEIDSDLPDEAEIAAWEKQSRPTTQSADALREPGRPLALQRALEALAAAKDPRAALLYLSSSTNARITADVALVADDVLLGKMRTAVNVADTQSAEGIGWALEKTTLLTLADAASKAPLTPEMIAVLAVHTGEVGRHPDLLTEIANAVGNAASLQERLTGENFIALEDNSASARVRAFDWLKAQGKAPAGFDPLGPPRSRRAAINRAISTPGGIP